MKQQALNLLAAEFTHHGSISASAVHTCNGTPELWKQLEEAGYVRKIPGFLGHPFSYELTKAGGAALGDTFSPYDHPFFCKVCRNTFAKKDQLLEHTARKHPWATPIAYP